MDTRCKLLQNSPVIFQSFCRLLMLSLIALLISPASSFAARITAISLEKSAQGDVLHIQADGELDYQSFDLNSPPRLVLNFPNASVRKSVAAIRSAKSGVRNVAVSASKSGVRLDVTLSKPLAYTTDQKGDALTFRFAPVSSAMQAKAADAAVLKDISIRDRGDVTELIVRGEHMNASHDVFVTNQGRNLIVDFWGATSHLPKEHYLTSTQKVSEVTVGKSKGRVRLVVKLLPGVSERHQIDASSGKLVVRFGSVTPKRKAAEVLVEDVHFKPKDRIAQLVVRTNVSDPIVNLHEEKGIVIIDIRKARLAKGQERSQDVSAFPGPLKQVDAYKLGDKVRIVARLRDKVEISSFQQGNILTVTFVPEDVVAAKSGVSESEKLLYTGQKVSFDYQGIDIKNALRLIAELSNMNFIMDDGVQGKLNMHLENVPWDQALDIILTSQGLGKDQQGNVMRIAPLPVLVKERQNRLAARKSEAQLEPLVTEFLTLSFANATEIKTMLETVPTSQTAVATAVGGAAATPAASVGQSASSVNSILSPRGSFVVDERTNTLIIKDTQESVNNIKRLIAKIDVPVKQVLIEARIVEATDSFTRELGVSWGGQITGHGGKITNNISSTSAGTGGFLVDLPAAVSTGAGGQIGLTVGALNAFNLNLELSAAEADNKIKIISSPRVVTTNLKTASITQGKDIPFVSSSANGGTLVQFKKANLGLEVTPQITSDSRLILHVKATKDEPLASTVLNNPIIDIKKIETEVFLNNGETIVIGGIFTRKKTNTVNGVPGLSSIPLLGWLFKKDQKADEKTELLIFLTPTILNTTPQHSNEMAQGS